MIITRKNNEDAERQVSATFVPIYNTGDHHRKTNTHVECQVRKERKETRMSRIIVIFAILLFQLYVRYSAR